jgi:hypothetical protein
MRRRGTKEEGFSVVSIHDAGELVLTRPGIPEDMAWCRSRIIQLRIIDFEVHLSEIGASSSFVRICSVCSHARISASSNG